MALCTTRSGVAAAVALLGAFATGCSGTGNGDTGDPRTKPNPNEYGAGSRITDLVGPATWLDPGNMMSAGCAILSLSEALLRLPSSATQLNVLS